MEEDLLKGKVLLVVDDEVDLRDIVASELEFMGAQVFQAENIATAQKLLSQHKIDLIVSDIRMPGGTGIDLLVSVKSRNVITPPIILITGFADITVEDAFNKGAEALVNKPFKLDDLIKMVVRYTSPFEERFKEDCQSVKEVVSISPNVKFGRGGFTIQISTEGKRYDVGDAVKFKIGDFEGLGVCRWLKAVDNISLKALMGIEFMNLNDPSLKHFKTIYDKEPLVPYIPASNI
jgi:CheY-like chemotaxis protein